MQDYRTYVPVQILREVNKPFTVSYCFSVNGSQRTVGPYGRLEITAIMTGIAAPKYARLRRLRIPSTIVVEEDIITELELDIDGSCEPTPLKSHPGYPRLKRTGERFSEERMSFLECVLGQVTPHIIGVSLKEYNYYYYAWHLRGRIKVKPQDVGVDSNQYLIIPSVQILYTPMGQGMR